MQSHSPSASDHGTGEGGPQGGSGAAPRGSPWRRWPRWLRLAVEITLGALLGLVALGAIAIWRLSSEPVRLDFLTPYLERAVVSAGPDVDVEVGETLLMWEGWPRNVDLRARRIRISDGNGGQVALLPDVSVTLSLRALLQGTVAPTFIEVIGPELSVERAADGSFSIGTVVAGNGAPAEESEAVAPEALRGLLASLLVEPDPQRSLSFLSGIRVRDGRLALRDQALGQDFRASDLVLELRREEPGIGGELSLELALPGEPLRLEAAFTYDQSSGAVDLASSFTDLRPDALQGDWPGADVVRGLELPLGGSLTLTVSDRGRLDAATFDITGQAGLLDLGERLPEPRPLRALRLSGTYDGAGRRLVLQDASVDFGEAEGGGPSLALAGSATLADDGLALEGRLRVLGLRADELPIYWPRDVGANARAWIVENIKTGLVEETELEVALRLPEGGGEELERFDGRMRYRDLDVHYLRPMPPVRAVSGSATFDKSALRFAIAGGRSGAIEIGESEAVIEGFDRPGIETMAIDFPAAGPLRDVLTLLNHERISLIDKIGLDPSSTAGSASSRVRFAFPLLDKLTFDEIDVTTEARMERVAIKSLLLEKDATDGRLGLALNGDGMAVSGTLKLGGVPLEIDWREAFSAAIVPRSHYEVLVPSMDDEQRRHFGFDVLEGLSGPVSASVVADSRRDGTTAIQVALNLEQAGLAMPEIHWAKPVGQPGTAAFTLLLRDGRLAALDKLRVETGDLSLEGAGRFDERGDDLASLSFSDLRFGRTALRDVTLLRQGLGQEIRIGGGVLDAEPFLAERDAGEADPDPQAEAPRPPLRLRAEALDAMRFGEGRYLERVAFDLERIGDAWNRIQLVSQVPRALWHRGAEAGGAANGEPGVPRELRVDYRPSGAGRHSLELRTNDAGAALRALDILDTMEGGDLRVTGEALPGEPLQASLEMESFTMIEAPVLARLLLVASLTGIVEGLTSSGLAFDRMVGDFSMSDGQVTTELMRAYGSSLGLTAKGRLDHRQSEIELSGTIVPVYGLNRLLNEIPVLGTILTGGEGEGFVAFTYDMTGALDDPQISVNPLSALAPGWLRGIFSGSGKGDEPTVFPEGRNR